MSKELTTRISPESIEIANAYLEKGDISSVSEDLDVPKDIVVDYLNKREVKKYIDSVYLDSGYRNRSKLASVLDDLIDRKLEEAEETEMSVPRWVQCVMKRAQAEASSAPRTA